MTPNSSAPGAADPGRVPDVQLGGGHRDDSAAYVAGLRRRRAASWRCPPLECGRRDPLDPVPVPNFAPKPPSPELVASWRAAAEIGAWWIVPADVREHLAMAS